MSDAHGHAPSQYRYQQGCRHPACRAIAVRQVKAAQRGAVQRAIADPALIQHGTNAGYCYWGCRCLACTEAYRLYRAGLRAARRQREGLPLDGFHRGLLGTGRGQS